jgi:serine/threonine protein kinase
MKSLLRNIRDYQILEKLGRGGMADVYLAVDGESESRIALKLVERGEGAEAAEIVDAERLGAQLQQHLSQIDPRVPKIYAFGDLDSYFFIAMEFVEGTDLSVLIGERSLSSEAAARIASDLCNILRKAHGATLQMDSRELRAIVHGDIKPKNIRIDSGGQVRVLDFGIAKGLSITRRLTSNVFGSVAYSSPERLETGRIDENSDLWSVGIVLYEMIAGRLPFEASTTERLEAVIRSRTAPKPLENLYPTALAQIVYKALAPFPEQRYWDAGEFESDIEAFRSGKLTLACQQDEATRRTVPADSEETRCTISEAPQQNAAAGAAQQDSIYSKVRRQIYGAKRWIIIGCGVLFTVLGSWEGIVDRSAVRLRSDFAARRIDAESAWNQYDKLSGRSPLGLVPLILRGPLKDLLVESCERVFNGYSNSDNPRVREGDWIRCKRYLSRTVQLNSSDRRSAAMLEYANGHILRINRKSLDAIGAFQRAASLQPKWPDPYLGMARTYIWSLGDLDRGAQALEHAQQLGQVLGKRELLMMAEVYRARGQQAWDNANLVRGTDREKNLLKKSKEDFNSALRIYLQISPWGDSTTQILMVQDSLAKIDQRMLDLNPPNPLLPWNWFK